MGGGGVIGHEQMLDGWNALILCVDNGVLRQDWMRREHPEGIWTHFLDESL